MKKGKSSYKKPELKLHCENPCNMYMRQTKKML